MVQENTIRRSITIAASFAALIWALHLIGFISGASLHQLGVFPRVMSGLLGVATGPLVHGSWQHVFGNTLPLILLGSMLIYGYPRSRWWALAGIWLVSGLGVWLFARSSYHFGASGVTHGMFFYLFIGGILRRDKRSAALLMVAFYLYGGMLLTIFPRDPGVSFESHLFGGVAGALLACLFRRWDPKPGRRRYSWEEEADDAETGTGTGTETGTEEAEDSVIGDQWKQ